MDHRPHRSHRSPRHGSALVASYDVLLRWQITVCYLLAHTSARSSPGATSGAAGPTRSQSGAERERDQGIVSVESIGWIGIAVAVVAVVGLIVRTKLTSMANALPDTLGW